MQQRQHSYYDSTISNLKKYTACPELVSAREDADEPTTELYDQKSQWHNINILHHQWPSGYHQILKDRRTHTQGSREEPLWSHMNPKTCQARLNVSSVAPVSPLNNPDYHNLSSLSVIPVRKIYCYISDTRATTEASQHQNIQQQRATRRARVEEKNIREQDVLIPGSGGWRELFPASQLT